MAKLTMLGAPLMAAGAIALSSYWMGRLAGRPHREPIAENAPLGDREDDNRDYSHLVGAVARLERRLDDLEARQAPTGPSAAPSASAAVVSRDSERFDPAKEEEKRLARQGAIDAALNSEPRDKSWASFTEGELRMAVDSAVNEGAKFSLKDLRCLTSLCELVLTAATAEDLGDVSLQLASKMTGMSSVEISPPTTTLDGRATVTCRSFRKGYARPDEVVF